jgi:two-component system sensor histidine kinase VicK
MISALSIIFIEYGHVNPFLAQNVIYITFAIFTLICIAMAIFTKKKIIEPMSKMLKSAVNYKELENVSDDNDEIAELVNNLRKSLKDANDQKRQTDTILTHMTDGVISFDMNGKVSYINPAAISMLNLKESSNNFEKIFSKYEDINMEKIIYLDTWTSSEKKIETEQGSLSLFFVPFKDEINRPTGLMVVMQDITEHVRLDNMRKEFVADVSHELKTPLTSIKGFSETLLEDDCDKETRTHFLGIINDNANRMEQLVQDLLTLSRYDNKRNKAESTDFDLGELTKSCKEKFDIEIKKKNLSAQCFVTADVPPVHANKDGIERVILNIISNSVKYTPDGGKIDVYVGFVHSDAYVKIKDTGIGIPKEDLDKVFERFYRVDKARTRKMGGTGLGLSIAKEIVEQNNGSININSQVGKGTEVVIRIPVAH